MSTLGEIVLLDTSIYLNVLNVDGFNQDREAVLKEFERRVRAADIFLLPLAAVLETGNHIAKLPHGQRRRHFAELLVADVRRAIAGENPYRATHFPGSEEFAAWLADFPDFAMRNKSVRKVNEGGSLADHAIFKEWGRVCGQNQFSTVRIWSLDSDLAHHCRHAPGQR